MYIYIKEAKKDEELIKNLNLPKLLKKFIIKIKKAFNIILIKQIDKIHFLYIIPKVNNIKIIENIIKKNNNAKIVLSKELKKYEKQLNIKNNRTIIYFVYDILQYIMNKTNEELQLQKIYILANEYNEVNLNIIRNLIDKAKTINIVTENVNKYASLEEKLYNEQGILITVSNNKNKTLRKAEFIINLDFNNEDFKKYKINRNSLIINCNNQKIQIQYFQGIIINNIEIDIEEKEEYSEIYKEFEKLDIYQSFEDYNNISKKATLVNLIGNNGIINEKEILNLRKNIDK